MNIILMILLISLLILVHEMGHYVAARICGIKVSKFGFGLPFGPTLYEKKIGDTTFYIHAFLLGGYVSFPDDEKDSGLSDDSPELFKNKSVGQRSFVAVAGVTANVICAIILVLLTAFAWGKLPSSEYEVFVTKIVAEKGASVYSSGLQVGDKIISVNGQKITNPLQINFFAQASRPFDGKISKESFEENYEKLKNLNPKVDTTQIIPLNTTIKLLPTTDEKEVILSKSQMYGVESKKTNTMFLNETQKELRDSIRNKKTYKSDGKITLKDVAFATSDSKVPLTITVERNNKLITLKPLYPNEKGIIGIERQYKEIFKETKGLKSGITNAWNYLYSNTETMIWSLGQIFTGKIPLKDLHGIVAITKVGGDVIEQQGLFKGLLLTAVISLNLAIVNLLPIPALDGGHLMFLLIEKIRGRAIKEETLEKIGNTGFYLLIALMVVIIFNDVVGLITKKF
ncbi:RIP metalloprotease RseP [bacterium]|nr:RIP metalloprotease RseP [bacterium]